MSVLYFAKVNYNNMYEIYDNKRKLQEINNKIFAFLTQEVQYVKIESKQSEDGKFFPKEIKYEFLNLEKENNVIIGNLIKNDYVYLKTVDRETTELITRKEETDESILFYYDVNKEIIVFHTNLRFGYVEFSEVFQNLLNMTFKKNNAPERFSVGIKNNISSISRVIKDIKKLGVIKELKVDIIPPNLKSELIKNLEEKSEKSLEEMKKSNITRKSTVFVSDSEKGLDIDSSMISETIEEFKYLHKELDAKDVINNTYGEVTAISKSGNKYSSKTTEPLKFKIEDNQKNRKSFKEIMEEIIYSVLK